MTYLTTASLARNVEERERKYEFKFINKLSRALLIVGHATTIYNHPAYLRTHAVPCTSLLHIVRRGSVGAIAGGM